MNEFKTFHPTVNFLYFSLVIGFSMCVQNPLCIICSLICSFLYSIILNPIKAAKFNFMFLLPLICIAALINPVFNHNGITIIGYFKNGNPLTAESIIYGFASSGMLASVICWFSCFNIIMTSDKFTYLFGKLSPALSLLLSMVLRFVPRFKQQIKTINRAQSAIGKGASDGNFFTRIKNCISVVSIMVTWALENAIQTTDSMKSRGYGQKKRTAFSIFRFERRDIYTISVLTLLGVYFITGIFLGAIRFNYFPALSKINLTIYSISVYLSYFFLCITPIIIEVREAVKWKAIKSKI